MKSYRVRGKGREKSGDVVVLCAQSVERGWRQVVTVMAAMVVMVMTEKGRGEQRKPEEEADINKERVSTMNDDDDDDDDEQHPTRGGQRAMGAAGRRQTTTTPTHF